MGVNATSTPAWATTDYPAVKKKNANDKVVALLGNPNVGKSTLFNALTGMNQHTGNWPGKTVASAQGLHHYSGMDYILVDLPGTYSLMANSAEEEIARDFLLYGGTQAVIVVCDATCLERNLNLVFQVLEITSQVVVCVNLMDEARKKGIILNLGILEKRLGVPVVGTSARTEQGLGSLMEKTAALANGILSTHPLPISYPPVIEKAISQLEPLLDEHFHGSLNSRWLAMRILSEDEALLAGINRHWGFLPYKDPVLASSIKTAVHYLHAEGITVEKLQDQTVLSLVLIAEEICAGLLPSCQWVTSNRDRKLDRILTSKLTGIPIMLALLCSIFWLTITGANYPSELLTAGFAWLAGHLTHLLHGLHSPGWFTSLTVFGVYQVLAWVVAVMLPPMAIFFPLFTLLEDFGYLPRVAFNLDHQFKKAKACGKQALTMCMGFGCNAAGVVGCRIIDSPRERLIAIITNNFVPCNGRFPTLIALISMFFLGSTTAGIAGSLLAAVLLTGLIVLGIFLTFLAARLLSATFLKGEPSSFTLELPPYRKPQFLQVLARSFLDRTLFVLGRAAMVAAPAGLIIWLLANTTVGNASLLKHCATFLNPFAQLLGMDGVILLAFILGFPANEIVVPIMIMTYLSAGSLQDLDSLNQLKTLLTANGWTWSTAVSVMLFCLIHWPCSTTCLTIRKESGSWKWTFLSIILPTVMGITVCFLFTTAVRILC